MKRRQDPLKMQYKKVSEASLIIILFLLTLLFLAFKRIEASAEIKTLDFKPIDVIEVPTTIQQERLQRPQMPSIPVESEEEDIPADLTIDPMDINWNLAVAGPPPALPDEEFSDDKFYPYDTKPEIIGGYAALAAKLVYPEIARKAGVEGRVTVEVVLNKKGKVIKTKILKSLGNNGCDEAAINAIKSVTWKPAYQRDKPVMVKIAIPIIFRLK